MSEKASFDAIWQAVIEDKVELLRDIDASEVRKALPMRKQGKTLLMKACQRDYTDVALYLLECLSYNKPVQDSNTKGRKSSKRGHNSNKIDVPETYTPASSDVVNIIIHPANPEYMYYHWTALHFACSNGNKTVAEALLKHGANPFRTDSDGKWVTEMTPLRLAAYYGHTEVIKIVLKHCGMPGSTALNRRLKKEDSLTPIFDAVLSGNAECVEYMLEQGASVNIGAIEDKNNIDEAMPLHYALVMCQRNESFMEAQQKKLSKNEAHTSSKQHAILPFDENRQQIVHLVLKHTSDANLHSVDEDGETFLHLAVESGNTDVISELSRRGAKLYCNGDDLDPLDIAVNTGDAETLQLLWSLYDKDISFDRYQELILEAVKFSSAPCVSFLLGIISYRSMLCTSNQCFCNTLFDNAVKFANTSAIQALIKGGVYVHPGVIYPCLEMAAVRLLIEGGAVLNVHDPVAKQQARLKKRVWRDAEWAGKELVPFLFQHGYRGERSPRGKSLDFMPPLLSLQRLAVNAIRKAISGALFSKQGNLQHPSALYSSVQQLDIAPNLKTLLVDVEVHEMEEPYECDADGWEAYRKSSKRRMIGSTDTEPSELSEIEEEEREPDSSDLDAMNDDSDDCPSSRILKDSVLKSHGDEQSDEESDKDSVEEIGTSTEDSENGSLQTEEEESLDESLMKGKEIVQYLDEVNGEAVDAEKDNGDNGLDDSDSMVELD